MSQFSRWRLQSVCLNMSPYLPSKHCACVHDKRALPMRMLKSAAFFFPPHDNWEDSMFERSLGRRWDLKGSVSNPVHAFSFPNLELNVYKYTNQDYFWTCIFRNLESSVSMVNMPNANSFIFICISFLKLPYAYVQAVRRICWLLLCLNGFSTVDSVSGGLMFLFSLLLLGKVIPHHTNLNVWMHQILVRWLFSVSTLVCHYIKYTMCCVMLFYLGRKVAWNEHPGTTRGTRRREGGSDYVRISLLWLISSVPSLSLSCCLFESPFFFSNGWLHQLVIPWKLLKNGCYGSLPPPDVLVISATQIWQAAERHCRSISDCFDGDCIILLSSMFFFCFCFFASMFQCCVCAVLWV